MHHIIYTHSSEPYYSFEEKNNVSNAYTLVFEDKERAIVCMNLCNLHLKELNKELWSEEYVYAIDFDKFNHLAERVIYIEKYIVDMVNRGLESSIDIKTALALYRLEN